VAKVWTLVIVIVIVIVIDGIISLGCTVEPRRGATSRTRAERSPQPGDCSRRWVEVVHDRADRRTRRLLTR